MSKGATKRASRVVDPVEVEHAIRAMADRDGSAADWAIMAELDAPPRVVADVLAKLVKRGELVLRAGRWYPPRVSR